MKILVACEESQAVTKELRRLGHEAYSCDILDQSGGHPEWHIMQDVLPLINGRCSFKTTDGVEHHVGGRWDALIVFPPCTDLANSGAKHFAKKRADGRQRKSVLFFCQFLAADCAIILIENPVGIMSGEYVRQHFPDLAEQYALPRKPTQIIQPYEHGDPFKKTTCVWIKEGGVWIKDHRRIEPTNVVEPKLVQYIGKDGKVLTFSADYGGGSAGHGHRRSKTYPGIAKAIAEQLIGPAEEETECK